MPRASATATKAALPFRLCLLGSFRLERDSQTIRLPTRKVESLLAYLALFPEQHTREKLAALLWGDVPDALARGSLRKALTLLREHLGGAILLADRETVQLNSEFPIWVDAREISESRIQVSDLSSQPSISILQSLISLYAGDLLADFYDDWIVSERERYRTLYVETLLRLTQQMRAQSEYARAIEFAHKVLASDPANERAHQHLMFCYLADGNRNAALRQYEECQRHLQEDLAVEPAPETKALYLWIKQTPSEARAFEARITNLPIPLSSFIGRKREMAEVKQLLAQARLVTLVGAGGSGKTRLAIQVATDLIDGFKDGVWWTELASLADGSLIPQQVAKGLGVQEIPDQPLSETLANWLQSRQLLLVLDNCEHLVAACAQLVEELLNACRNLKILATSREALGITGEKAWRVESLTVPEPQTLSLTELLLSFESVHLFVERASAINPDFALTDQNAPTVAQICQRLDGIPLAIELAAARAKTLSVGQVAARLDDRFNLLTRGSRTALPRQQTLRATIDWGYDLLDDSEQTLLRRLSVFTGGWTLDTAEIVCGDESLKQKEILDLLSHLVDKSLVVVELPGEGTRYRLLETIRLYAREKLIETGEAWNVQRRHLDFFVQFAVDAEPKLQGAESSTWMHRIEVEHDHLRAALRRSLEIGNAEVGLKLGGALGTFWDLRGYWAEGRAALEQALEQGTDASRDLQAKALKWAGRLAEREGDLEQAKQFLEKSLALYRELGDKLGIAAVLHRLGLVVGAQADYASEHAYNEESLALFRELGDRAGIANALHSLGTMLIEQGDFAAARALIEESLGLRRELGHTGDIALSLLYLGMVARFQGDYEQATNLCRESLALFRELEDRRRIARCLQILGRIAKDQGNYEQALALCRESLSLFWEAGARLGAADSLWALGAMAAAQGQAERAARLFGAAEALHKTMRSRLSPANQAEYARDIAAARAQSDEAAFEAAWAEGRAMTLEQAVAYVVGTTGREQ